MSHCMPAAEETEIPASLAVMDCFTCDFDGGIAASFSSPVTAVAASAPRAPGKIAKSAGKVYMGMTAGSISMGSTRNILWSHPRYWPTGVGGSMLTNVRMAAHDSATPRFGPAILKSSTYTIRKT